MNDLIKRLENLLAEVRDLKQHLDLPQKEQRVLELEERMQAADFWSDNENAQKVSRDYNQLKKFYDFWQKLEKDVIETLGLAKDLAENNHTTPQPSAGPLRSSEGNAPRLSSDNGGASPPFQELAPDLIRGGVPRVSGGRWYVAAQFIEPRA